MPSIHFTKMHGAGNDFIVLDNRYLRLGDAEAARLAQRLCPRRTGVGADGVVLLDASRQTDFRMRHYNADGSRAAFCGNGARCLARFAYRRGAVGTTMTFDADDGRHEAHIVDGGVRLRMGVPSDILMNRSIPDYPGAAVLHTMNTGVPHAILLSEAVTTERVEQQGRILRYHPMFQPDGVNVNFVQRTGPSDIKVRTYERGVEAETLSCGTGAVASALTIALLDGDNPPVHVRTQSGETLVVDFHREGDALSEVTLEGSAHILFDGELTEES